MMELPSIPRPTVKVVQRYVAQWHRLENYRLQEDCLNKLFSGLCPENKTIEDVLLKVSALNDFYSTHIYNTYSVAKHILRCQIDDRLANGDPTLVNRIAKVRIGQRTINFYSFASKYCSHHRPERFTIYDYYVERMLLHFRRVDRFDKFGRDDLKNYARFLDVIRTFHDVYALDGCSMRDIDIFLWLTGKKHYPRKYYK